MLSNRSRLLATTVTAAALRTAHSCGFMPGTSISRGGAAPAAAAGRPSGRARTTTIAIATRDSSSTAAAGDSAGIFLFDFDGVVCDSCDECTVSALRTCRRLGVLGDEDMRDIAYPPKWLFESMRAIRPAIEVGWQIPVLLAVFLERRRSSPGNKGTVDHDDILANYQAIVDDWLVRTSKTDRDMIEAFGTVRDEWIADDLSSWLDINTFYDGVPDALNACRGESIVVTTKQHRFATALMRHAGVSAASLPDDRIYGLGQYKAKRDVISERMNAGGYAPFETRFFEDRWPTIAGCLKDERLEGVRFYLCSWGYVTPAEVALATADPRVEVLDRKTFVDVVSGSNHVG